MQARAWVFFVFAPLGASGCSDANKHTYAQVAVATGLQLVAVGVHRAVTNDCWARCSPGYLCNQESGFCELGECVPQCEYGSHCARNVVGDYRCVRDSDPTVNPSPPAQAAAAPGPVVPSITR